MITWERCTVVCRTHSITVNILRQGLLLHNMHSTYTRYLNLYHVRARNVVFTYKQCIYLLNVVLLHYGNVRMYYSERCISTLRHM